MNDPTSHPPEQLVAKPVGRRMFLAASAVAAASWARLTPTAEAIEPVQREGSKFKFSLAAYSYRQLLLNRRGAAELTLHDFVDDCARFGLEGTELTSYYFPQDVTDDYLYDLRRHAFRQGLDVSGTAVGNDFGHAAGPERERQIASVKGWIEHAAKLGAPVIRIFAGHAHDGQDAAAAHRLMVDGIEECCDYAGRHGIHLALENHGGPTATADGLLKFVRDVQSPWFGVNVDTGNFRSDDVYRDLARVAPYALNVQVKVVVADQNGRKTPTDFAYLARLLQQATYRGYVVLEYEEDGDPRTECPRYLDALRAALQA